MTLLALGLILAAAFAHATWNFLAKQVGGGVAFVWLFALWSTLLYAPLVALVLVIVRPPLGPHQLLFMLGSATLHIAYFLLLQRGYRVGDLSLVYPLARGTGPTLASVGAIAFLGERPGPVTLAGTLLVVVSVFLLTGGRQPQRGGNPRAAIVYGLLVGAFIGSYTLWDKHAVSALAVPPLLLDWGTAFGRTILLAPLAARRRDAVWRLWRERRAAVLVVAVLSPLAYLLFLTALRFTPVTHIAPAREISILVGTFLGTRFLTEGDARRRLTAAGMMVIGVIALALG